MNLSVKKLADDLKKELGWKWYWYKCINWLDDRYLVQKWYDLWWWMTDGEAYWDDSVPCHRKLCRHCGNKPFNHDPKQK